MEKFFRSEASDSILEKAIEGERISPSEALELYNSADFLKVTVAARAIRNRRHDRRRLWGSTNYQLDVDGNANLRYFCVARKHCLG